MYPDADEGSRLGRTAISPDVPLDAGILARFRSSRGLSSGRDERRLNGENANAQNRRDGGTRWNAAPEKLQPNLPTATRQCTGGWCLDRGRERG